MKKDYWVKKISFKKGTLHHQLGVSSEKTLPVSLLNKIMSIDVGKKVVYNKKHILVTGLLKKRVNLALNLKKMRK